MTDNIFEIEPTPSAHGACAPRESGTLLTDFAAARPTPGSFLVLEKAELPAFIRHFLCMKPANIFLKLEASGKAVRQVVSFLQWHLTLYFSGSRTRSFQTIPPALNFSSLLRVHMLMTLQWRLRLSDH